MPRVMRTLLASVFSIAIITPPVSAQEAQDPNSAQTQQKLTKEQKKKSKQVLKELGHEYKQWLNEDVVYIITPAERTTFLQLGTNEEREQFIEQFWLRRSSNPDVPENDFKEEHYRRIAYANEHFASGIPGWKTDRGKMYIIWGPAVPMTGPSKKAVARQPLIPGKRGAIAIWKASAKTLPGNSLILQVRANTA
jgi:GWxTD domain-containing protein